MTEKAEPSGKKSEGRETDAQDGPSPSPEHRPSDAPTQGKRKGTPRYGTRGGSSSLPEETVDFYLRRNPDYLRHFLDENPEMLLKLLPGGDTRTESGREEGVVDLRQVILERLRGEVTRLKDQQRSIISASRTNLTIQNRIHSAALHLLDAESFQQLIDAIATDLPAMLDLDVAALVIERSNWQDAVQADTPGIRVVAPDYIDSVLEGQDILLQSEIHGEETLYGQAGRQVRSQALIRLRVSSQTPACLLALGSREPEMFQDGMRTELTAFLAGVLERCIRQWLNLPA